MQDKIQKQLLDAFLVVLRPIAKILLRYGIGYREFSEVVKAAFVDVATAEYGIRNRPTNVSRIAVMTGLTRKEVRRLRDVLKEGAVSETNKDTPLDRVLQKWRTDPEYSDENGRPVVLSFSGQGQSLAELTRQIAGDVPPGAVRTELLRIGAIAVDAEGMLSLTGQDRYSDIEHDALCQSLLHDAYALLASIEKYSNAKREDT